MIFGYFGKFTWQIFYTCYTLVRTLKMILNNKARDTPSHMQIKPMLELVYQKAL